MNLQSCCGSPEAASSLMEDQVESRSLQLLVQITVKTWTRSLRVSICENDDAGVT